ncbi:MAG TPA: M28 family peptidase [Baekduia sp.]|nr:M28 family peptidase [Baekduia sp.]
MFDPRLYRAALLMVVLAVLAGAFSLQSRPNPATTTLAPEAFSTVEAWRTLTQLHADFPDRRPGSAGEEALGRLVATRLQQITKSRPEVDQFEGATIDGKRTLLNVSATIPGAPGPGIVVVAHRDAAGHGARAELSATAVLLELARVAAESDSRRTITFASTSGGSGGLAGARRLAEQLRNDPPLAVIVVGDSASRNTRKPTVIAWSNGKGQAPLRLQRSAQAAVRKETRREPGAARAPKQWGRMAFPLTVGEQGAFGREGIASVLIQASGERGPAADAPVSQTRLQTYGRAVLRLIYALDQSHAEREAPQAVLVAQGQRIPYWTIQLIVGALLVVPLIVAVDGYARIRRRDERVGRWAVWTLSWSLPFIVASALLLLLKVIGVIGVAPPSPIPGPSLDVGIGTTIGLISIFIVFALTLLFVRPFVLRFFAPDTLQQRPSREGASVAVMLVVCVTALVAWAVNAYAAALLVPAVHLWLLALSPEARLKWWGAVGLVLLSMSPLVALALIDAAAFGWSLHQLLWSVALLIAGGHASLPIWLLSSLILGSMMSALMVAVRLERFAPVDTEAGSHGPGPRAGRRGFPRPLHRSRPLRRPRFRGH